MRKIIATILFLTFGLFVEVHAETSPPQEKKGWTIASYSGKKIMYLKNGSVEKVGNEIKAIGQLVINTEVMILNVSMKVKSCNDGFGLITLISLDGQDSVTWEFVSDGINVGSEVGSLICEVGMNQRK